MCHWLASPPQVLNCSYPIFIFVFFSDIFNVQDSLAIDTATAYIFWIDKFKGSPAFHPTYCYIFRVTPYCSHYLHIFIVFNYSFIYGTAIPRTKVYLFCFRQRSKARFKTFNVKTYSDQKVTFFKKYSIFCFIMFPNRRNSHNINNDKRILYSVYYIFYRYLILFYDNLHRFDLSFYLIPLMHTFIDSHLAMYWIWLIDTTCTTKGAKKNT